MSHVLFPNTPFTSECSFSQALLIRVAHVLQPRLHGCVINTSMSGYIASVKVIPVER